MGRKKKNISRRVLGLLSINSASSSFQQCMIEVQNKMILRQFLNFSLYQLYYESRATPYLNGGRPHADSHRATASIMRINVKMEDISSGKYELMKNRLKLGRDVNGCADFKRLSPGCYFVHQGPMKSISFIL